MGFLEFGFVIASFLGVRVVESGSLRPVADAENDGLSGFSEIIRI